MIRQEDGLPHRNCLNLISQMWFTDPVCHCVLLICHLRGRDRKITKKLREIGCKDEFCIQRFSFIKLLLPKTPEYLFEKMKFRTEVYTFNLRHRFTISLS